MFNICNWVNKQVRITMSKVSQHWAWTLGFTTRNRPIYGWTNMVGVSVHPSNHSKWLPMVTWLCYNYFQQGRWYILIGVSIDWINLVLCKTKNQINLCRLKISKTNLMAMKLLELNHSILLNYSLIQILNHNTLQIKIVLSLSQFVFHFGESKCYVAWWLVLRGGGGGSGGGRYRLWW